MLSVCRLETCVFGLLFGRKHQMCYQSHIQWKLRNDTGQCVESAVHSGHGLDSECFVVVYKKNFSRLFADILVWNEKSERGRGSIRRRQFDH